MPIWFIIIVAVCAVFGVRAAIRGYKGDWVIAGQSISRPTIVLASLIILVAWALLAAIQLGLIPDHAP